MSSDEIFDSVELTAEEIAEAILEGKKKKYFHSKHDGRWEEQEKGPKTKIVIYDKREHCKSDQHQDRC